MNRRKPDSICFNSYDFKADNKVTPCNCSEADIECEFGYEWTGTECVAVPHVEANQCSVRSHLYCTSLTAASRVLTRCRTSPCVCLYQTHFCRALLVFI